MMFATPVPNGRRAMLGSSASDYFTGQWWASCGGQFAVSVIRVTRDGQMEQFFNCFGDANKARDAALAHFNPWKADPNTASVRAEVRAASGELIYSGGSSKGKTLLVGLAIGGAALAVTGTMVYILTRNGRRRR